MIENINQVPKFGTMDKIKILSTSEGKWISGKIDLINYHIFNNKIHMIGVYFVYDKTPVSMRAAGVKKDYFSLSIADDFRFPEWIKFIPRQLELEFTDIRSDCFSGEDAGNAEVRNPNNLEDSPDKAADGIMESFLTPEFN